ncbi:NEW3 domain-containing protein [Paenibacillus tengchongensis]|uniref:COG1470 family protein n=1 Tax=Paenibacillus tengchongensis TaxID=2608684 RepID=UPI001FE583EA|nr:NEW3 domain-containing protein [Paenibacillus tengchongensis]
MRFMRTTFRKPLAMLLIALLALASGSGLGLPKAAAAGAVELYTPYLELSAAPGESITYPIDVINHGSSTAHVGLSFQTGGNAWDYELTAGGRQVQQLAVKAGESQSVSLQLEVPLEIDKGSYSFAVAASGHDTLALKVNVSEQGTFKTELTVDQANMLGHSDTTFTYSAVLSNRTAQTQSYALSAQAEAGWDVRFKADGNSVTSVELEAGAQKTISIEAQPPEQVKAGTYKIPVTASTSTASTDTELEAVVSGTYGIQLSTSDNLLSTDIKAGGERRIDLVVTNTGSAALEDISLSSSGTPTGWEVSFEPSSIRSVEPGASATAQAVIKSSDNSLPGDYAVSLSASSPSKSASADLRVAVKTSVLWGWIGVLIIAAVVGGIYYLFRRFGRR